MKRPTSFFLVVVFCLSFWIYFQDDNDQSIDLKTMHSYETTENDTIVTRPHNPSPPPIPDERVTRLNLKKVRALVDQGRALEAGELIIKELENYDKDEKLLYELMLIKRNEGQDPHFAWQISKKILEINPNYPYIFETFLELSLEAETVSEAIEFLEDLRVSKNFRALSYETKGRLFQSMDHHEQAVRQFQLALISSNTNKGVTWKFLAESYKELGKDAKESKALVEGIKWDQNQNLQIDSREAKNFQSSTVKRMRLLDSYSRQGNWQAALVVLERLLEQDPLNERYHSYRKNLLEKIKG